MRRKNSKAQEESIKKSSTPQDTLALVEFTKKVSLDVDLESTRQLQLRDRALVELPGSLGVLLKQVRKIDLAGNSITDLAPLASVPQLTNLTISKNSTLQSLAGLRGCALHVLTAADCAIRQLSGLESSRETLRTLILNNNNVQLLSPSSEVAAVKSPQAGSAAAVDTARANYAVLASLTCCETVVLSRNSDLCGLYPNDVPVEEGGGAAGGKEDLDAAAKQRLARQHPLSVFENMTALKKLSLSGCGLQSMPTRWFLPLLTELRLSNNKLTTMQPEGVIFRSLKILDVSHNQLSAVSTFRRLHFLQQIHLSGNPLMQTYVDRDVEELGKSSTDVPLSLQRSLPKLLKHLEMIDGHTILSPEMIADLRGKRLRDADEGQDDKEPEHERPSKRQRTKEEIMAETESKDVVVEMALPSAVNTHETLVRRERNIKPVGGAATLAGTAAFNYINEQMNSKTQW